VENRKSFSLPLTLSPTIIQPLSPDPYIHARRRELLYSSQAPSVSLHHPLPGNAFEPFHSMSQTIKARLRELVKQQEADFTADQDAMDVDSAGGEEDKMVAVLKGWLIFRRGF
jgi:hypothetical protein